MTMSISLSGDWGHNFVHLIQNQIRTRKKHYATRKEIANEVKLSDFIYIPIGLP